jgi:uncharacterized protein (DUF39 family)
MLIISNKKDKKMKMFNSSKTQKVVSIKTTFIFALISIITVLFSGCGAYNPLG